MSYHEPDESPMWSARERDGGTCDHTNMQTWTEGRGEAYECRDCGLVGWNSYADMYGVSDADFI